MDVVAYDVREQHLLAEVLGFRYVLLDDLIAQADVVSLHVPYFPATHHLINRERLAREGMPWHVRDDTPRDEVATVRIRPSRETVAA